MKSAGKCSSKCALVLEGVMDLGVRHRARLEPAVEDFGDAPHRPAARFASGGAGAGDGHLVDEVLVQVREP